MSLTNPTHAVTAERLQEFYNEIFPYLNGPKPIIYGFRILRDESSPYAKVVYLKDAVGMTPAHMNFTNGTFDYGSWADTFFMPRPCMLKYDGRVDYYLNPNDYTKKIDGTASDVANTSYAGNAMMEWPKIWMKIVPDLSKGNEQADIFISNQKIDSGYKDWSYHNSLGKSVNHFYTRIYNASVISGKFRSISGQAISGSRNFQDEINLAEANNPSGKKIWMVETIADVTLINVLLILISKNLNVQARFGRGLCDGGSPDINNGFRTGVHNDKGLFYGTNSGTASTYTNAVKVFGMENYWGFQERRLVGELMLSGTRYRKLTYNKEDGSSVVGYNTSGSGYVNCGVTKPSGYATYISKMVITEKGFFPIYTDNSSASTYYCDGILFNNSGPQAPKHGGGSTRGDYAGMFYFNMQNGNNSGTYDTGSGLSARPLS